MGSEMCIRDSSGGEQQRVALARAFAVQPKILFADEPTGNLDEATSDTVSDLLFETCRHTNTTLVVVTHSNEVAVKADRALQLHQGVLERANIDNATLTTAR